MEGGEGNEEEKKEEEKKDDEEFKRRQEDFDYTNAKGRMEVVSIIAHELGHWANLDSPKLTAVSLIQIYVVFFFFSYAIRYTDMPTSFGFHKQIVDDDGTKGKSVFLSLFIFFSVIEPVNWILGFFTKGSVRRIEYAADVYSVK